MTISIVAWATSALAQLPIPGGAPTEVYSVPLAPPDNFTNMAAGILDLDTVQIPLIVQSLTVTQGQGGIPAANFGGVVAEVEPSLFPGWKECDPDCTTPGKNIDVTVLNAYLDTLMGVYGDERGLAKESQNLVAIDARAQSATGVLTVLKAIADLLAMSVQEQQYQRQQLDALITVQTIHHAQDLNDSMQAQATYIATTPGESQAKW